MPWLRQEMRRARGYLDLGVYTEAIEDYVVEYLCKDEVSATGAADLFQELVKQAEPGTSFQTLAMKLHMRTMRHTQTADTASRWSCQGLPLVHSEPKYVPVPPDMISNMISDMRRRRMVALTTSGGPPSNSKTWVGSTVYVLSMES